MHHGTCRQYIQIISVKEEIHRFCNQYRDRLYTHHNNLTIHLTVPPDHRRLRRRLPTRFFSWSSYGTDSEIPFVVYSLWTKKWRKWHKRGSLLNLELSFLRAKGSLCNDGLNALKNKENILENYIYFLLRSLSPRANYIDRATAASRRN
jgi:hypothetical protein